MKLTDFIKKKYNLTQSEDWKKKSIFNIQLLF